MRIVIAAGASGGHIFPASALASELTKKGAEEIYFVSSRRRLDKAIVGKLAYPSFFLSVNPMPYRPDPLKWTVFFLKLILDAFRSFFLVLKLRPDAIVSFGGYCSGPISACGVLLGVPLVIHEQNYFPGRANKALGPFAGVIATSFEETEEYYGKEKLKGKIVFTGNPVRRFDVLPAPESGKRTVLIMGGSQGASFLNAVASEAAVLLKKNSPDKMHVIHLTGAKDFEKVKRFYGDNGVGASVFPFLENIEEAYSACDVAVTRSGASALFELARCSKPMILVPYPNPKNSQRMNALAFARKGAAAVFEERDLSAEKLAGEIRSLLDDGERCSRMKKEAEKMARPEAASLLADEIIKILNKT